MDIITPLHVLRQGLDATTLKRLGILVQTMLTMTGRITMLGLSRWAEKGGSYRTIQRFYLSLRVTLSSVEGTLRRCFVWLFLFPSGYIQETILEANSEGTTGSRPCVLESYFD